MPIGTIIPFAGKNTPDKYLFCDGSTFSKTDYPELYAVLESTTLPNLDGRFLEGSSTPKTQKDAGLPNITGDLGACLFVNYSGAFQKGEKSTSLSSGNGATHFGTFDASRSSSIYGKSTTVQPKSYTVRYLIRAK